MKYYIQDEDKIKKYNITYDRNKILDLKQSVIEECSEIKSIESTSIEYPFIKENDYVSFHNIKSLCVGVKETKEGNKQIYKYTCDKYYHPYLVVLIDRLLNDDPKVIEEIINLNGINETNDFDEITKRIDDIIMNINNIKDINEKLDITSELYSLLERKIKIINTKPIKEYYYRLQKLIHFELEGEISYKEYQSIQKFFDLNYNINNNILKLKR